MTTITRAQFDAQAKHYGLPELAAANFVAALGIQITAPDPPEAMVKLAADACANASVAECEYDWQDGYIAALQDVAQIVRDAPQVAYDAEAGGQLVSRTALLRQIGAE